MIENEEETPLNSRQQEALSGLRAQVLKDFLDVPTLNRIEAECGRLPADLRDAYAAFEKATIDLSESLAFHGVRR